MCDPQSLLVYVERDVDVHTRSEDGITPIHCAVMFENLSAVKLLVAYGANVNSITNSGRTLLHVAVSIHTAPVVDHLLQHGAVLPPDLIASDIEAVVAFDAKR